MNGEVKRWMKQRCVDSVGQYESYYQGGDNMKQRVSGFSMKSVMRNGAKACLLAAVALALGVGG